MKIIETLHELPKLLEIDSLLVAFFSSFLISIALVLSKRWHGSVSMDLTEGLHKIHTNPTPRIGGLPIVLALLLASAKSSPEVKAILTPILLAGMPAFLLGLAEDLTKVIGVAPRLLGTMASGFLAWWLTDYSLTRLDIFGLDSLMKLTFISVVFTSFAIGGIANSINIIDGFNGLSTLTCTIAFIGLALIALQVGDLSLALSSLILAFCVWGLFWVNWPLGKIFLGDGGAYFIGFALAWMAVLLIERNKSVSAFSAVLICILPITEVLFSIFRRRVRKAHPGHPDRLHFHSIFQRRYINRWLTQWSDLARNSLVGFLIGSMSLIATILAIIVFESTIMCLLASVLMVLGYLSIYLRMVRHNWRFTCFNIK